MASKNTKTKQHSAAQVKKYLELKTNANNGNVKQDVRMEKYAQGEIDKIFQSDIDRQDGIGYVQIKITEGGHISFVATSDIHVKTAKAKVLKQLIDYIENTNTYVTEGGDILQMDKDGYNGGTQESRINSQEEVELLKRVIKPIAHKIIAATGGNHDDAEQASRLKDSYLKVLKSMYEELGVYYSSVAVIIEWIVPVFQKNKVVGSASLVDVLLHNRGKTKAKKIDSAKTAFAQGMGIVDKFNQRMGTRLVPDFIHGGHFHAASDLDEVYEVDIVNDKGLVTGTYLHTIRVRSNHTLQDGNSSSFNRGFNDRQIPTFDQTDVHFVYNDSFNPCGMNTKPKFVPVVTEFPILTKSGKLTAKAQEYMENRKDNRKEYYLQAKTQFSKSQAHDVLNHMNAEIDLLK